MRIRYCIISALTISLIASAPLNASAEALNDSFCSAEEIDEDIDNVNTYDEDLNDDFISNGSVEDTEVLPKHFHLKLRNHVLYQILCQMELEVIGISLIRKLEMRQQL